PSPPGTRSARSSASPTRSDAPARGKRPALTRHGRDRAGHSGRAARFGARPAAACAGSARQRPAARGLGGALRGLGGPARRTGGADGAPAAALAEPLVEGLDPLEDQFRGGLRLLARRVLHALEADRVAVLDGHLRELELL